MNKYKYLPGDKKQLYTPIGVKELFQDAVNKENGNIKKVLTLDKYKKIIELWHASPLAVAIYNKTGDKFFLYPSENPDVHFIKMDKKQEQMEEGFSLEVMSLYNHNQTFDQDYDKLTKNIWDKKGLNDYDRSELLLIARLNSNFNVDKFIDNINKYQWKFLQIWLSAFSEKDKMWRLINVKPYPNETSYQLEVGLTDFPY
ncbi:hypothetical protein HN958_03230 [Candidatus Falkowbacteria bacterium]|jgi:hypothetical protein|nr:hypothetical protein [Candidatus Falkowbacteria bacterium]